ncbi:MAG: bifunctional (p)ppGpp synthetase/guanosine-3',5'-bis(diphosphate) 3'-pyrophosphohydrolase [Candidatus Aminicenantaceae bacterium]
MNIETLIQEVQGYSPKSDPESLRTVCTFMAGAIEGQQEDSGRSSVQHSLDTAMYLAKLQLDPPAISAALLHDILLKTSISLESIRNRFGDKTARLVEGFTFLSRITWEKLKDENVENLQKMFLAMADDARVVIIKLAEQLDHMRNLKSLSRSVQNKTAKETLHIYAPLASKLGIWSLKGELEDVALQYLDKEKFDEIDQLLAEHKNTRADQISAIITTLMQKLAEQGISAEILGRPKHIYSIYKKMKNTGRDFREIYDIRGVRILVNSIKDCYAALDVIQTLWQPIKEEFDDYIANPKSNGYRSIQAAVIGPQKKPIEIQIRTQEMHQIAEFGVASHWRYKEKSGYDTDIEAKISYLRILLEWQQELAESEEYFKSLKAPPFAKYVYVFTPKGDIFDLQEGATPLDFAYRVHTDLGHRCRGAKVNGKLTSLNYKLQNGDRVEVVKSKEKRPSRDWLNPKLGYASSPRTKQKIRYWFRKQEREANVTRGRETLEREFKRSALRDKNYEEIAGMFKYKKPDDLFEAIDRNEISAQHISGILIRNAQQSEQEGQKIKKGIESELAIPLPSILPKVLVTGMKDFLTRTAHCCRPLPGDDIVGFVTRGRGVTIHRQDCHNIVRQEDNSRLIDVDWGKGRQAYAVKILVEGTNSKKLLKEIAVIAEAEGANILTSSLNTRHNDPLAVISAILEITDITQLNRILNKIRALPYTSSVKRLTN